MMKYAGKLKEGDIDPFLPASSWGQTTRNSTLLCLISVAHLSFAPLYYRRLVSHHRPVLDFYNSIVLL